MILALDTAYSGSRSATAGVLFKDWQSESPEAVFSSCLDRLEEYLPGQFYKRELPCILNLLNEHALSVETIIVDGNVYLDDQGLPGLGKHLFNELNGRSQVVGVAKNRFKSLSEKSAVYRGSSTKPVYVTTTFEDQEVIKANVQSMHGKFRIPTLLKIADTSCRETLLKPGC